MNRFYIITNQNKDKSLEVTSQIKNYIEGKGKECILAVDQHQVPDGCDCILVLGGDGTLIRAARDMYPCNIPLLGINMGTLGYLTEVEVNNLEECLDCLMFGETQVEERMLLQGVLNHNIQDVALNDIVLTRSGSLRIIDFNVYVNGELLNTYHADGIIISTPTGSTAYNLSAGGPIVEPTASLIVITPICSHALNTRSIVLSSEDVIELEVGKGRDDRILEAAICFDGDHSFEVQTGDRIKIQKANDVSKMLKLNKVSFLETLRKKMKGN